MKIPAIAIVLLFLISGCSQQTPDSANTATDVNDKIKVQTGPSIAPEKSAQPPAKEPALKTSPFPAQRNDDFSIPLPAFTKPPEHRQTYELITQEERSRLPECGKVLFTKEPVPLDKIVSIEPIGSTSPPEHALASSSTDTYIAVKGQGTTQTAELVAPGDMWITAIMPRYGVTQDPQDHVIHYAMCKDVFGIVDHVKGFSPEMEKLISEYKCPYGGTPGDNRCPILLLEPVKAGTRLGEVGRLQGNFNFGTWDLRTEHKYPSPKKYGPRSLHSSCPFDYYAEPLKGKLTKFLEGGKCGTVQTYVKGTLQGEWFFDNVDNRTAGSWFKQIFFGPSNRFSEKEEVSVGGVISQPLKWVFTPKSEGKINRKLSDVKAGSGIYCYESGGNFNYDRGPKGRILVQVLSDKEMKAEYSAGSCTEPFEFEKPFTFNR